MKTWSFCTADGLFTGASYSGPESSLVSNTPIGHLAIEGAHDHTSSRYDTASGRVVDYQPPQPSADHEWDATALRWKLKPEIAERNGRRQYALAQIQALEQRQARPLREALAGIPGSLERVQQIDADIAELRKQLT